MIDQAHIDGEGYDGIAPAYGDDGRRRRSSSSVDVQMEFVQNISNLVRIMYRRNGESGTTSIEGCLILPAMAVDSRTLKDKTSLAGRCPKS